MTILRIVDLAQAVFVLSLGSVLGLDGIAHRRDFLGLRLKVEA